MKVTTALALLMQLTCVAAQWDFSCIGACLLVWGRGHEKCLQCLDTYADFGQVPPTYAKDMLAFKVTDADYTTGFCGTRRLHPEEGVDMAVHPTGWMAEEADVNGSVSYTGCETTTDFPGVGTTSYQLHGYVKAELEKIPGRQNAGEIWRGNELGIIVMSGLFWEGLVSPQSIGLGANVQQHKVVRPILEELVGYCDAGCQAQLQASAKAFMAARDTMHMQNDVKKWVFQELFQIVFPGEANPIDADEFVETQASFLTMNVVVQITPKFIGDLVSKGTRDTFAKYFRHMEVLIEKHYGARLASEDCSPTVGGCVAQVAMGVLDFLLNAGGLSVPSGITTALWVLHMDTAGHGDTFPQGYVMDKADVLPFYYESLRFFPPVLGFPYWSPAPARATDDSADQFAGGSRHVLNVALALRDPNAWGADAHKFRVRPASEYHEKFIGFADFATDRTVADGAMDRSCPGKHLALMMGKAWLQNWEQNDWKLEGEQSKYKMVIPFVDDFVLTRQ